MVSSVVFKDELDRLFLCNKFLLQSGADPTIYLTNDFDPDNDSALFRSILGDSVTGSVVSLLIPVVNLHASAEPW
jgi:hypothetical protein